MSEISRVALFGKLNSLGYKAVEGATVFCKLRGNPYVELAHWFTQIMQTQDSDLHRIVRHFGLDAARIAADFTTVLDGLPRGHTSISDFSEHIENAIERGWVYGTLLFGERAVRSGHLVVACLKTHSLRTPFLALSKEFQKIKPEALADDFSKIVSGSPEDLLVARDGFDVGGGAEPGEASGAMAPAQMGKQEALRKFSVDLTEKARNGEIDPVLGRDEEIRQIVDILMRRRQNNPILTGEAGVGKTAVVEGFAARIVRGDVPPQLKDVTLRALDIGLLQAGASMKGEFENRLRQVIDEVQSSAKPIILFIDEAHTLIGAGGAAGTGDAANLLKPALARGKLRTIAATTWAEYKKYFEKDPALTRRFQVVQVPEPTEDKAILMMRGVASTLEKHHQVQLLDEALEAAVRLSHRYIPARQLPDKAVSLTDTACARVAVSQHATPPEVEDTRRAIEALENELAIIEREQAVGIEIGKRRDEAQTRLDAERPKLAQLEQRWKAESELVARILDLRAKLRAGSQPVESTGSNLEAQAETLTPEAPSAGPDRETLLADLRSLQAELAQLQGDRPLILPTVDEQAVAAVVGDWTGIPVGRMVKNEIEAVLNLAGTLNQRVIGQRHGLDMISRRVQTSRAKLDNPGKPIGVFMLCGPSGVGKTETALALAESLYGGEQNIITINMSEYQEAHTVSTLKGAPPGYVGYGEGGVLTEAVRRRPYSVVLLDEVEKAHPDVHEIFFQVFDKGWMEDGEGRYIDFKNTIIILTSNVGTDLIMGMCRDPDLIPEPEGIATALREPLLKVFPAALLGRVVVIPYYPLSDEMLGNIVRLQLNRIARRVETNHGVPFEYDDEVVKLVCGRCIEIESGGRMIDAILTNTVLPAMSSEFLNRMMEGRAISRVVLGVSGSDFTYRFD
ncbi:MAG: type VI secretion system ATPase TssH [Rhodocyclaceae bacterium]|nr:type VI secretion system ATPase TssH [Rhodocyclaceae bacterium]MBX3668196.1 type VI secretion system ATPase TssH [Rhodocyclaceae bacterium]